MQRVSQYKCFGGSQEVWEHSSDALGCVMKLGVYLPPQAASKPCPVVYWLSGLTCTEQNFITKAGAQRVASELGLILVAPDTSPRGPGVADDDDYDLGMGAGFYINATREPWASHYKMYDYIVSELPQLIEKTFDKATTSKRSILGHSMGGHGALMIALKNPGMYQSVSAFSPIVAPSKVPWGEKAFTAYLGEDEEAWKQWDTCELVANASERLMLLVDQGTDDSFYASQLQTEKLREACEAAGHPFNIRLQEGYDHSYYFISTFIEDHLRHHASALNS